MPESRAVERSIEPGNSAVCPVCGETVKFKARTQGRQVIANIYVNDAWDRRKHCPVGCSPSPHAPLGPPGRCAPSPRATHGAKGE